MIRLLDLFCVTILKRVSLTQERVEPHVVGIETAILPGSPTTTGCLAGFLLDKAEAYLDRDMVVDFPREQSMVGNVCSCSVAHACYRR